jgi:hypothetical protein
MTLLLAAISVSAFVLTIAAWRMRRTDRRRSGARVAALAAAIDPGADEGTPLLFSPERSSFADDHPLLRLAAAVVLVVALGLIASLVTYDPGTSAAVQARLRRTPPLALLSMRHERRGDTLTVTGLVRNHGRLPAEGITAIVFAFDRSGTFVASARAPLDFRTLGPGEESPFRVAVPHVADVGRYRVTFRDETGVVRHLDRRKQGTSSSVASREGASGVRRAAGEL